MATRSSAKTSTLTNPVALAATAKRDLWSVVVALENGGGVDKACTALRTVLRTIDELLTNDERVGLPGDITIEVAPSKAVC